MPRRPWLIESDKPSYQVLKWVGGGGFGQVYKVLRKGKVVACKQVQLDDAETALDEYDHMKSLQGAPHIAALHDGIEFNRKTGTLSFFMDYYKGKDLDKQVHMLRGAAENFTESQIIEIGYQIALGLEFCHSRNIIHQDMKPMNVLLRESWNPMTQRNVPDLFIADFGIASHVQTISTRLTTQRGTPGYEAPEIRGQGSEAAFSWKSDVYAFGCILYRLCSLRDPIIVDDLKPRDISGIYTIELMSLISSMLCSDRDDRPGATQIKEQLAAIAQDMFTPATLRCPTCYETFPSRTQLSKHHKKTGHSWQSSAKQSGSVERDLKICGVASGAPPEYHFDESGANEIAPSSCIVCRRLFDTKKEFFRHLYGIHHYRGVNFVRKRRAEDAEDVDDEHQDKRLAEWVQKDMGRHD